MPRAWQEATHTVCPEEPHINCDPADHQGFCEQLPPVTSLQHSVHPETRGAAKKNLRWQSGSGLSNCGGSNSWGLGNTRRQAT